ncbi:MAG TPA: alpha-amylase family glycosyl hydrolase [Blastocatellia bacterium]|nr:alpha-amylase family glycosyl hydrolase [Blastocatellia bacterium]
MRGSLSRPGFLARFSLPLALLLAAMPARTAPNAPEVLKVEPPNWWAGHSINPVRLLVRGRNLAAARVEVSGSGFTIDNATPSANGNYLFIDVSIDRNAAPGRRALRITNGGGATEAHFEIIPPLDRRGRFQGFSPDDCIYLIMPDRFSDGDAANNEPAGSRGMYKRANPRAYHGGDLQGIIDRLPYLKDLGVTAIWTTPVYDNTNRSKDYEYGKAVSDYHGYGAIDFYRVEEHLGTLEKYRELVDRAHALGIKIIQDQVANHSGPDHVWTSEPPTPTWLNGTPQSHPNNLFDIKSVTEQNPDRERFEATIRGWFANILPDINQDDPQAARYVIQNAVWWIGITGLDAVRQDTFPFVHRRFWSDWNKALETEFPQLTVVGEVFDQRPEVTSFFQGGRARFDNIDSNLHTVFDFPSYFAIRDVFIKGQPMKRLTDVLDQDHLYTNPRVLIPFIGNHDVARFMGEKGATLAGLKLAHTYLLTMRGTPQLYYGDEIAMEGSTDPDNRRDFPGGFPGDARNAFRSTGRTSKERDIFNHIRKLLHLRAKHPSLRGGDMKVLAVSDKSLAFMRESKGDRVIVAINNSDAPVRLALSAGGGLWVENLYGKLRARARSGKITVSVPPRDSYVLSERR